MTSSGTAEHPSAHKSTGVRDSAALNKVLMIGLDGATFDVLDPLMDAGRMPNLRDLIRRGTRGILDSTKPPITPAAWTTFMTGKGPGRHGIIDFLRYNVTTGQLSFNNYIEISGKTIWELLSERGYRVGSINLPMTYPPRPVNGFMISGFDTPSVSLDFTYPRELKAEILRRHPDYTHEKKWQRRVFGGDKLFAENLRHITDSFDRGCQLAEFCGERYGWDVMMVLFKLVDNLQHKAWKYIDPQLSDSHPRRRDMTVECFAALDRAVGRLVTLAREKDASIMVMSDHGHGSLVGKVQPNCLLNQWGYLRLGKHTSRIGVRSRQMLRRLTGRKHVFAETNGQSVDRELAVDWSGTRACVLHAGIYGFLYLNVADRQPYGIVPPGEYDALRDEIRERLLSARAPDPHGRPVQLFVEVHKPEELYDCNRCDHAWMPDLLLVPRPGLAVVRKIRGTRPLRWLPADRIEGTHRVEGVFVAQGRGFRGGHAVHANIADIAPTLLAGLGLPVPADMEGRVLSEVFSQPVNVTYEPPQRREVDASERPILTREQEAEVADRLSDLGYLD